MRMQQWNEKPCNTNKKLMKCGWNSKIDSKKKRKTFQLQKKKILKLKILKQNIQHILITNKMKNTQNNIYITELWISTNSLIKLVNLDQMSEFLEKLWKKKLLELLMLMKLEEVFLWRMKEIQLLTTWTFKF